MLNSLENPSVDTDITNSTSNCSAQTVQDVNPIVDSTEFPSNLIDDGMYYEAEPMNGWFINELYLYIEYVQYDPIAQVPCLPLFEVYNSEI